MAEQEIPNTDTSDSGSIGDDGMGPSTAFGSKSILDFLDSEDGNGESEKGKGVEENSEGTGESGDSDATEGTEGELLEKEDETPKDTTASRPLTLVDGDKQVEVQDNATLEVTIDGKKEKVSIKDLRDNYSGKVAYDRKFTQLSQERKAFKDDVDSVDRKLAKIFGTMKKDWVRGLQELYDMAGEKLPDGKTPEEYFTAQAVAAMQEIEKLTPEQRTLKAERAKLEVEKEEWESDKTKKDSEKTAEENVKYVESQCAKFEVNAEVFNKTWERLKTAGEAMVKDGKANPLVKMTSKELTDLTLGRVKLDEHEESIQKLAKEIDPSISSKDFKDIREILQEHEKSTGKLTTKEEIDFVIREVLGKPAKKAATKQNQNGRPRNGTPPGSKPGASPRRESEVADEDEDYSDFNGLLKTIGVRS